MAKKVQETDLNTKMKEHFEAVKEFYKRKSKDVHKARKIRKEIARIKTQESKAQ